MDNQIWVRGIKEKYPKELLDGRQYAEANVVGLIFKDPLLMDELDLSAKDFVSLDGRFYFSVASVLRKKGLNEFSEVAILSNLEQKVLDRFNDRGGYETIKDIADLVSSKNKESIFDSLAKYNIYLKLHDAGFNLLKPITIQDRIIPPMELFKNFDSNSILEWYEVQLSKLSTGFDVKLLEDSDLDISDDFIDKLYSGDEQGVTYANAGLDMNGDTMHVFPWLSNATLGLTSGASHYIAGFSSSGKTAMMCSMIFALVNQGEKVLIICNEQSSKVWKINLLTIILRKYFHYSKITKSNLMTGKLSDEDKQMLKMAQEYFNNTFKGNVHFIQMAGNDMGVVKSKIRFYALQYGYSTVVYDTFKIGDTDRRNRDVASWEELIQASRDLDIYAKRYDLIMLCSIQLAQANKGALFLDSNMLSGAKGIVEQLDTLLCIRDVYKEELDPESKYYCHPYKPKKNASGKWEYEDYLCDPESSWKMIFLAKSRNSENSGSSQSALMFRFYGQYAIFHESCYCRPKHGYIQ